MALHNGQGWLQSNVLETALEKFSVVRFAASIVVQATVCSAAQCRPVVKTSANTIRNFPLRAITVGKLDGCGKRGK